MANIASQKKRILRSERERLENKRYTSAIKTYFRRLESAVASGDADAAAADHRSLVQTIDKAIKRGALHRNTGARKKSRAARLRAERERLENRRYTSAIRTYFRRLEAAVTAGDGDAADADHATLVQTIDKAVKRGALHRNNAARKKSRAARLRKAPQA